MDGSIDEFAIYDHALTDDQLQRHSEASSNTHVNRFTCSASSEGGTSTGEVIIRRDATPPLLSAVANPVEVPLNGLIDFQVTASDSGSGLANSGCDAPNTSAAGEFSVQCWAIDNAGNRTTSDVTYRVLHDGFEGFFPPVDMNVLNKATAGQTIPLKFRVTDAQGQPVTTLTTAAARVTSLVCPLGVPADAIEEYSAGSTGLQNLGDGNYQYNWKTPKSYSKSCKTLHLTLGDEIDHTAQFQFTR